ncbi:MAG: methylated-DNA--[protein]-cysteine S-methyltransferase [Actinomycetota bacterium]
MKLDPSFLERFTAAAVDEGVADVVFDRVVTPIGELLVALSKNGLCKVAFPEESHDEVLAKLARGVGPRVLVSHRETEAARGSLAAYFEGEDVTFDLPIDFSLVRSDFGRRVLDALAEVPRGETTTYGKLAVAIGNPRASRATGTALGRNPIPIVVPCHRVLQGSGSIGGYGGQPWRKEFLLKLEGALAR